MAELLIQLYRIITYALSIYSIFLVIYILMSWVPASRDTKFGKILEKIAEPYLGFFRNFIPPLGMIDISPIVALFALQLIGKGLVPVFNFLLRLL
ncbi:YggT family protein [Sporosarcina sp. D27]|uniref:YggT family protein n=1 Tax=Sporosarcina sp. D27 TaxID=1382305 RepID=UPI0004AF0D5F|nr:YggT family protein [Sporosarcina sp. D27]